MNDIEDAIAEIKHIKKFYSSEKNFDLAIIALEKQLSKKPKKGEAYYWIDAVKYKGRNMQQRKKAYSNICPVCDNVIAKLSNDYCGRCGQKIDWMVEE